MEWGRTDQSPVDTWVVGYFQNTDEYSVVRYTHEKGWHDREGERTKVPTCWVPVPSFA